MTKCNHAEFDINDFEVYVTEKTKYIIMDGIWTDDGRVDNSEEAILVECPECYEVLFEHKGIDCMDKFYTWRGKKEEETF